MVGRLTMGQQLLLGAFILGAKKNDDAWSELPVGGSCAFDHWHASSCRCMPRMLYPVGRLQLTSLHLVLACLDLLKLASPVAFNLLKYANG